MRLFSGVLSVLALALIAPDSWAQPRSSPPTAQPATTPPAAPPAARVAPSAPAVSPAAPAPDAPIPLAQLFATGALSPGYPQRHATSTARPLRGSDGSATLTFLALQFNPALFAFGVWSVRGEMAFLPFMSILGEYNRLSDFTVPKLDNRIHLDGYVVDLGLHLWPGGEGLRGFYIGPRASFGSGSDREGQGEGGLVGYGGDFGYQWVAGIFAFNLGVGVGRATVKIEPTDVLKNSPDAPESLRQASVSETFWRPYLTVGLGFGF